MVGGGGGGGRGAKAKVHSTFWVVGGVGGVGRVVVVVVVGGRRQRCIVPSGWLCIEVTLRAYGPYAECFYMFDVLAVFLCRR